MTTIASQITSVTVVYSNVYSDADQRKHQSSASLAFVWGIHPAQRASYAENVSIWWRHHVPQDFAKRTVFFILGRSVNCMWVIYVTFISDISTVIIPNSKGPRIDIDLTLTRRESIGSMPYRIDAIWVTASYICKKMVTRCGLITKLCLTYCPLYILVILTCGTWIEHIAALVANYGISNTTVLEIP